MLDEEAGELNPEQRRFLQAVERNSGRLLRLVGDLLFVARTDAGRLSLEQGKVDLVALAAECVEGAVPAAAGKSIDLVLAARPVPAFIGDGGAGWLKFSTISSRTLSSSHPKAAASWSARS